MLIILTKNMGITRIYRREFTQIAIIYKIKSADQPPDVTIVKRQKSLLRAYLRPRPPHSTPAARKPPSGENRRPPPSGAFPAPTPPTPRARAKKAPSRSDKREEGLNQ